MLIGAAAGLFIGLQLFNAVFPGWEFSVNQILDYTGQGGYSTETDLNRLTAISRICNEFLHTISQRLFGFGLGSCETSTFFNSGFFQQYGETIHYTYLLQAFLFLETGFVGLFLYLGFYISISAKALIMRRFLDDTRRAYSGTGFQAWKNGGSVQERIAERVEKEANRERFSELEELRRRAYSLKV